MKSTDLLKGILGSEERAEQLVEKAQTDAESRIAQARLEMQQEIKNSKTKLISYRERYWKKQNKKIDKKVAEIAEDSKKECEILSRKVDHRMLDAAEYITTEFNKRLKC
ncbi:hypothetical protein K9M79_05345 [Candidatus Woesearchaeota archaeon]|nr:hypothetical protein [Candidatus Woesearchaeota archaeon]